MYIYPQNNRTKFIPECHEKCTVPGANNKIKYVEDSI